MRKEYPLVSIAMPTYNRGHNLEKFIDNIHKQSYPQNKLQIVLGDFYSEDNTYEIAKKNGCKIIQDHNPDMEYRRTLALKACDGKYIFIADDDNFFPNPKLIENMVNILENNYAVATQCIWEAYDKQDYLVNRYCALIGTVDPTTFYLNMQDHMPYNYNKWMLKGTVIEDNDLYYKVRLKPEEVPTMGDQGFLCKKEDLMKCEKNGIVFHMDICKKLSEEGEQEFAFMKDYFGHMHVQNTKQLMKKLKRNIDRYNVDGQERAMNYNMSLGKMIKLGLVMGTFVIPFIDSIIGFLRIHDIAWFVHPIICFRVALMYTGSTIKSLLKK